MSIVAHVLVAIRIVLRLAQVLVVEQVVLAFGVASEIPCRRSQLCMLRPLVRLRLRSCPSVRTLKVSIPCTTFPTPKICVCFRRFERADPRCPVSLTSLSSP